MSKFLVFVFIFFIGSIFGWILEILFRRIVHKKWVNPGFLVGHTYLYMVLVYALLVIVISFLKSLIFLLL